MQKQFLAILIIWVRIKLRKTIGRCLTISYYIDSMVLTENQTIGLYIQIEINYQFRTKDILEQLNYI